MSTPRSATWLPFQALNAIFATGEAHTVTIGAGPLTAELGLLVFVTYVLLATLAAGVQMVRRDV